MNPYVLTISSTSYREFPNKFKPGQMSKAYSFTATTGEKVDCGFADLGLRDGMTVEFMGEPDKYGIKVVKGTLQTSTKAPVGATEKPAEASTGGTRYSPQGGASGRPFPVPTTSGELAIIRQNALTNAVNFFGANYFSTDPDQPTLAAKADMVIELAYKFADFSSGQREVKAMRELANKPGTRSMGAMGASLDAAVKASLDTPE